MWKVVAALAISSSIGSIAAADTGPTMRLGLTAAMHDQSAPGMYEGGPLVALGLRAGPFVGEFEWSWLSFFDPAGSEEGVHRLGLSLRADVVRSYQRRCLFRGGCTLAQSLWIEAGAGERFGQWQLDATHHSPGVDHVPEVHVGVGIEVDNQIHPMRNGFQLGLRFALARRGDDPLTSCRSGSSQGCMGPTDVAPELANNGGVDASVLVEWMFLFGR
ncbi:MAG: hypothetical protein QM831_18700 [Kofleriaceae bacterium]